MELRTLTVRDFEKDQRVLTPKGGPGTVVNVGKSQVGVLRDIDNKLVRFAPHTLKHLTKSPPKKDPRIIGENGPERTFVIEVRYSGRSKVWTRYGARNGAWRDAWQYAVTQIALGRDIESVSVDLGED